MESNADKRNKLTVPLAEGEDGGSSVFTECRSRTSSHASRISINSTEQIVQERYPLYTTEDEMVSKSTCDKICRDLGESIVTSIHLDAETVAILVTLQVVNTDEAIQLRNLLKTEGERVLDCLLPAIRRGGNRGLERFYQALMSTSEGRLGHEQIARNIKRKVRNYEARLKRVQTRLPMSVRESTLEEVTDSSSRLHQALVDHLDFTVFTKAALDDLMSLEEVQRLGKVWQEGALQGASLLMDMISSESRGVPRIHQLEQLLVNTTRLEGIDDSLAKGHMIIVEELKKWRCSIHEHKNIPRTNGNPASASSPSSTTTDLRVRELAQRIELLETDRETHLRESIRCIVREEIQLAGLLQLQSEATDGESGIKQKVPQVHVSEPEESSSSSDVPTGRIQLQQKLEDERMEQIHKLESALEESILRERELKEDILSLTIKNGVLDSHIKEMESKLSSHIDSESKIDKVSKECSRYKAALNTCRKRIQSLERSDLALHEIQENSGPICTPGQMARTIGQFCTVLRTDYQDSSTPPHRLRTECFQLLDSLDRLRTIANDNLANL